MLGARSTLETAVGSRPKLNTTSTRTTNTAAERIAVRDRNSTRRSLAATVQLWRRSSGNRIAILLAHLRRPATRPRREMHEPARAHERDVGREARALLDRKSTRLNSSHSQISYAVFCLKKKQILALELLVVLACARRPSSPLLTCLLKLETPVSY